MTPSTLPHECGGAVTARRVEDEKPGLRYDAWCPHTSRTITFYSPGAADFFLKVSAKLHAPRELQPKTL